MEKPYKLRVSFCFKIEKIGSDAEWILIFAGSDRLELTTCVNFAKFSSFLFRSKRLLVEVSVNRIYVGHEVLLVKTKKKAVNPSKLLTESFCFA